MVVFTYINAKFCWFFLYRLRHCHSVSIMTSKRSRGNRNQRTKNTPPIEAAESGDEVAQNPVEESLMERSYCAEEFDQPFDLGDIQGDTREKMLLVAPMLLGQYAEYGKDFFVNVVGLCDQGPRIRDVAKVYPFIRDEEIGAVWKEGATKGRYELARCEDLELLKKFRHHFFKVYGNKPDNTYFPLRFLKACYATFVHNKPVNWCAEALDRHKARLKNARRNPAKLGPIATRCQVQGLCNIIQELSWRSGENAANVQELLAVQEVEQRRSNEVNSAHAVLEGFEEKYKAALDRMTKEASDVAEDALTAKYSDLQKRSRRVLLEGGSPQEYKALTNEMEAITVQISKIREADAEIQREVLEFRAEVNKQRFIHRSATLAWESAKASVEKVRGKLLTMKTPRVFDYPHETSMPPLGIPGKDICAYCGLGFVWKAAVVSSCGCMLHPPCVAEMIAGQIYKCKKCKDQLLASSPLHLTGPWIAQFGGELDQHHQAECAGFTTVLQAAKEMDGCAETNQSGAKV